MLTMLTKRNIISNVTNHNAHNVNKRNIISNVGADNAHNVAFPRPVQQVMSVPFINYD